MITVKSCHSTPISVSWALDSATYGAPHDALDPVHMCSLCLSATVFLLTLRSWIRTSVIVQRPSVHKIRHVAPVHVLVSHTRSTGRKWRDWGCISHQPGIATVGCLFIVCDLAFIGAEVQAHGQVRRFIPYSKSSLRDAGWTNSQSRGQTEDWAVRMPPVHFTVFYKYRKPMVGTTVDEEILALLAI